MVKKTKNYRKKRISKKKKEQLDTPKLINTVVWVVAIVFVVIALLQIPNKSELNKANKQINDTRQAYVDFKDKLYKTSPMADPNFNLKDAEDKATIKLTSSFNLVWGGIHSDKEFKKHKVELQRVLGTKLLNYMKTGAKGPNEKTGKVSWSYSENKTEIMFQKVTNIHDATIYVITSPVFKKTNSYRNREFIIHYDLVTQKVSSFTEQQFEDIKDKTNNSSDSSSSEEPKEESEDNK